MRVRYDVTTNDSNILAKVNIMYNFLQSEIIYIIISTKC